MKTKTLRLPDNLAEAVREVGATEHVEESTAMRKLMHMGYDLYVAEQYHLDPHEKCTLLRRLPDMHEPMCNQYWHEVEIMGNFSPTSEWMKKIRT